MDRVLICGEGSRRPGEDMDRLNHVKIVTPDPEAVGRFLAEVGGIVFEVMRAEGAR